jgi:hypothetical protein
MSYEGIVVLGVPRSGTTLVRRLLDAHPRICCPPETQLLSACSRFLEEAQFAGGLATGAVSGLGFSGYSREDVLGRLREFAFAFFREIAARAGKPRWAEKTAQDVFHLDAIEALCGARCRYVCVVRHGLDVACSIAELSAKMQRVLPELHEYLKRHAVPLEAYARAWIDGNERLLAFAQAHPDWCLQSRYEDLLADPATELARVLDFLGESEPTAPLLQRAFAKIPAPGLGDWKVYETQGVQGDSVGRYRSLDDWTLGHLAAIANPMLQRLGYAAVTPPKTASAEAARHAYELGRAVVALQRPQVPGDA